VTCLAFSNNGYHLAHSSEGAVVVSDLRKLKNIATLPGGTGASVVAFDASGKYLAFAAAAAKSGSKHVSVSVVQAKEWDTILATLDTAHTNQLSGLVWGPNAKWMATSSETDRPLFVWGTEK
jgi:WD40 repeat protein